MKAVIRISTRLRSTAPIPREFHIIPGLEHLGLIYQGKIIDQPEEFNTTLATVSDRRFASRGCEFFPYILTEDDEAKLPPEEVVEGKFASIPGTGASGNTPPETEDQRFARLIDEIGKTPRLQTLLDQRVAELVKAAVPVSETEPADLSESTGGDATIPSTTTPDQDVSTTGEAKSGDASTAEQTEPTSEETATDATGFDPPLTPVEEAEQLDAPTFVLDGNRILLGGTRIAGLFGNDKQLRVGSAHADLRPKIEAWLLTLKPAE